MSKNNTGSAALWAVLLVTRNKTYCKVIKQQIISQNEDKTTPEVNSINKTMHDKNYDFISCYLDIQAEIQTLNSLTL